MEDKRPEVDEGAFRILRLSQYLYPVARGEIHGLIHLGNLHQLRKGILIIPTGKGEFFPYFQGGGLMIHADEKDIHLFK